jgi:ubiquinone/menaquinone biosynthesis C-methylase UbiE
MHPPHIPSVHPDIVMTSAAVIDRLTALADSTRSRLLVLLEDNELTVNELCTVVQLPQSTVSRHLKVLSDEGWVSTREAGTSRFYRMTAGRLDPFPRKLWAVVREQLTESGDGRQDARRLDSVLRTRREKSQSYFSSAAGEWDHVRTELIGGRSDLLGLLDLIDDDLAVGDLGCGTGRVSEALAPCVRHVVAVDESGAMLTAARKRLASLPNAEVRSGSLEALPFERAELDIAVLCLALHFVVEPALALREVHRVLKPGGRALIIDLTPHDRQEYTSQMGQVWQGFDEPQIRAWLKDAGFAAVRYRHLPVDPAARGPTLFSALARRAKK